MIEVTLSQNKNVIRFEFNEISDAVTFVGECLEVGEEGLEATIKEV